MPRSSLRSRVTGTRTSLSSSGAPQPPSESPSVSSPTSGTSRATMPAKITADDGHGCCLSSSQMPANPTSCLRRGNSHGPRSSAQPPRFSPNMDRSPPYGDTPASHRPREDTWEHSARNMSLSTSVPSISQKPRPGISAAPRLSLSDLNRFGGATWVQSLKCLQNAKTRAERRNPWSCCRVWPALLYLRLRSRGQGAGSQLCRCFHDNGPVMPVEARFQPGRTFCSFPICMLSCARWKRDCILHAPDTRPAHSGDLAVSCRLGQESLAVVERYS